MFRGGWKYTLIMFLCFVLSAGLSSCVFMFIYNKLYIKELVSNGFKAQSVSFGTIEQVAAEIGINIETIE